MGSMVHPKRTKRTLCPKLGMSIGVVGFLLWFGIHWFRKMEKSFADLV
jgi:hypothetical protein